MLTHGMSNASHLLFPVFLPSEPGQPVYTVWAALCAIAATVIVATWKPGTANIPNSSGQGLYCGGPSQAALKPT
jgi:hypothetical protein